MVAPPTGEYGVALPWHWSVCAYCVSPYAVKARQCECATGIAALRRCAELAGSAVVRVRVVMV